MFVFIWVILLFSVTGSTADTGASEVMITHCENENCISLSEGEVTAEAGLCVVIPCSFTSRPGFPPKNIVWYKCDPSKQRCGDSDMIFHTNNDNNVQSGFRGRVALLEPDMSQNNCSIIISDLTESDSGSYQLRLGTRYFLWVLNEYTFSPRVTVSVKDLTQKPTVMVPPVREGQQTTLTCTSPGLCSGSDPKITWTWRGTGEKDSYITGNISAFKTENVTPVTQQHSSTLTFNPSVTQHHGTGVNCKVSFTNNITAEKTVTLNVTSYPKILNSSKCELQSEVLTCVCFCEGFPLPTVNWPLLKNYAEYSVMTIVSGHKVNSTIRLTVRDHSNTRVVCVSSSVVGEEQYSMTVTTIERQEDQHGPSAVLPWGVTAMSLIVNVICIIVLMFLCNRRKKVKPNQEDRTYMSLQRKDLSEEYDVIARPVK
ncbi:sialic acid-binding Ig-like lectin 6 isoform X2 [Plectropomus leopardus]|uniref:sialic acid-binding Ig-like lectin 6 isoform X2 n=1 Tax=Plectropomus leopardus TaxID=160734 RepID=UPI001C4C2AEB|nr:sialic acid-binding Ig-like lectin 6 isoform X2 [Plectropomus leopardus]